MNFNPKENSMALIETPFDHSMPTRIQLEEEIRRQAKEDSEKAFANVGEMLKEKFRTNQQK